MTATSTLFATTQYETMDVCPPFLQADNQESGVLALIDAIFYQAFEDWKKLKKVEANPKTHRQAKSALRKMEKTFCDSSENVLLLLYCSGLNVEPSGIFRWFPFALAAEVDAARAKAEDKEDASYTMVDFKKQYGWYNNK